MRPVATHAAWSVCPPSAEQREAVAAPAEGGPPARRKTDNITPISDQTTSRLAVTLILTLLILTLIPVTLNLVPSGAGALFTGFSRSATNAGRGRAALPNGRRERRQHEDADETVCDGQVDNECVTHGRPQLARPEDDC